MTKTWTIQEVRALGVRTNIETAASVLGLGRYAAYELARKNELPMPVLRVGRKYIVPVAGLLEALGIRQPEQQVKDLGGFATKPAEATNSTLAKRTESL